jgi:UDP-galactopyranose mutase
MPINLHTINQFFGATMRPTRPRPSLLPGPKPGSDEPQSFEEQALRFVGRDIYETFFKGYTEKQWGCSPADLPASILKRLPLRFNYDDNYFAHPFPRHAGGRAIPTMVTPYPRPPRYRPASVETVDTGNGGSPRSRVLVRSARCLVRFRLGRLGYRTLDFEHFVESGDWQGCPVMNHQTPICPTLGTTEHKHFAPWETHEQTSAIANTAAPAAPMTSPYYPIRLVREKALLAEYVALAQSATGVTFAGRLGTYRYLDMDVTIREALDTARAFLAHRQGGTPMPSFVRAPL